MGLVVGECLKVGVVGKDFWSLTYLDSGVSLARLPLPLIPLSGMTMVFFLAWSSL